jgi:hypothetical protein
MPIHDHNDPGADAGDEDKKSPLEGGPTTDADMDDTGCAQ